MRTTLTLDEDIAIQIRRRIAETGESFKAAINGLLRSALGSHSLATAKPLSRKRLSTPVFKGGKLLIGDIASTAELLSLAEGENFK